MLNKWTVENFKSVYDKTPIHLAPLTIFAGANSSGKSTIIQSMLLTVQTVQSPVQSRAVVLNGHIIRLGAYDDIVSNDRESRSISIGFELVPLRTAEGIRVPTAMFPLYGHDISETTKSVECSFSFSTKGEPTETELLQLQPRLDESRIKIELTEKLEGAPDEIRIARASAPAEVRAKELQLSDTPMLPVDLDSLRYEVLKPETFRSGKRYSRIGLAVSGQSEGATLIHFLPLRISIVFDAVEERATGLFEALLNPRERQHDRDFTKYGEGLITSEVRELLIRLIKESTGRTEGVPPPIVRRNETLIAEVEKNFSLQTYLRTAATLPPTWRQVLADKITEQATFLKNAFRGNRPPQFLLSHAPLPPILDFAVDYVRAYFTSNVKYLGPLRDEPKPVYPLSGATDPSHVGFRGEHTAAVLDVHKNTLVEYLPSKTLAALKDLSATERVTLITAVSDWLGYMGVVHDVRTVDKGKLGHELKVATSGNKSLHDLTHVGVGVSQVLPILVLSLLAGRDSTLIFEQPELHLHPRVQTRLADFFVSMTKLGKQCVVETHSEYLINRLRYLSAISEGKEISENVIIYFVEKDGSHSKYRPIRITEYGVIPDWPKGFFDENEENSSALLRAAMEKRRQKLAEADG